MTINSSIAVDLDGVLFDFNTEFCNRFGSKNQHLFDLHKRYEDVDRELITEFIQSPSTYENLEPIFGGVLFVNIARQLGLNVVLLTSRPKSTLGITIQSLAGYHIQYDDLIFAYDKKQTIEDYNRIYPNCPIKMLVDDRIEYLKDLPDGVVGMAWEQSWNNGYYPRLRYNPNIMQIEGCDSAVGKWKPFWRK